MKANLSGLAALLLLAGCAAGPQPEQAAPQDQAPPEQAVAAEQPPAPAPEAVAPAALPPEPAQPAYVGPSCPNPPPWVRASRALNRPVVQSGAPGRPVFSIKRVSYAEIMGDRELIEGVRLIDATGREPPPATVYNIVWTPEEVSCTARYSAPAFFDVR